MPPAEQPIRVTVEILPRAVTIRFVDSDGRKLEDERFILPPDAPDVLPRRVARDVFDLLYQCANTAIHDRDW